MLAWLRAAEVLNAMLAPQASLRVAEEPAEPNPVPRQPIWNVALDCRDSAILLTERWSAPPLRTVKNRSAAAHLAYLVSQSRLARSSGASAARARRSASATGAIALVAFGALACSSSAAPVGGTGGQVAATSGGTLASGGSSVVTGQGGLGAAGGPQSGGALNTGGSASAGAATGGNSPASGGDTARGGSAGLNGAGGTPSAGGSGPTGGAVSTGGVSGSGAGGGNAGAGAGGKSTGESGGNGGRAGGPSDGGSGGRAGGPSNGGTGGSNVGGAGGSTSFRPCPTNGDPCKVLPLGDSITHGLQSSDNAGYRSQLFKLAVAANQKITFTGSQSSGPSQVSGNSFPKNHEGHDGWTVDPGFSKYGSGGISSLIPNPALSTVPNIVLLMIGTNDITSTSSPGTTADRLDGFLGKLVQAVPDALIVVAQITPVSYNSEDLKNYNAKIPSLVQARIAKGQHLIGVDMSKMPTSSLAADGVHPNDQGYSYMANVWYEAIKGFLPN